ncbi:unnamed protein product [Rhizoctonia solani]|uniref:Uncharacterized protein n=1 Tax=Rhizoctonia solani TaxID=456999 RepID=A0A8H3APN4_9AGAM|nr:unnamed protein product [Rhizoctonia solani]
MNTLLEDYGSCLDPTVAKGLEEETRSKRTIVAAGVNLSLSMGRIVVQESWRLPTLIYLFMVRVLFRFFMSEVDGGLGAMWCGFERRTGDQGSLQVFEVYARVEASRIPDSFLVLPMLILGLPVSVK